MEYVVIAWAGEHLLKNCLQGFCQHLSFDPQSTHVVTISAEFGLTKPLALHTHAIQNLCLESSCICTGKCLCDYWCSGKRGVQLLLECIQEICKRFAILGQHTDPKETCSSASFMLVAVVSLQCWFRLTFCTTKEFFKKAWFEQNLLIGSATLWWCQTLYRHLSSQIWIFAQIGRVLGPGSKLDFFAPQLNNFCNYQLFWKI